MSQLTTMRLKQLLDTRGPEAQPLNLWGMAPEYRERRYISRYDWQASDARFINFGNLVFAMRPNFSDADLSHSTFYLNRTNKSLIGLRAERATLINIKIIDGIISRPTFWAYPWLRARTIARFAEADLSGSEIQGGSYVQADFHAADLEDADLSGRPDSPTYLNRAGFTEANLIDITVNEYTVMRGCDFRGASVDRKALEQMGAQLRGAVFDD